MTTEYTYKVRIDGDIDTYYSRDDLDQWLDNLARQIVDDCEQEINEGDQFDNVENGQELRDEAVSKLQEDIHRKVEAHLSGATWEVHIDPWYAVAQRMTCTFVIKEIETDEDAFVGLADEED